MIAGVRADTESIVKYAESQIVILLLVLGILYGAFSFLIHASLLADLNLYAFLLYDPEVLILQKNVQGPSLLPFFLAKVSMPFLQEAL